MKGKRALKARSVTSRSIHSIAQSLLFKHFIINLEKKQQGSLNDMLADPQICAAIRSLVLFGPMSANPPRNNEKKLSLIKERLPKMVRLKLFRYPNQDHPCSLSCSIFAPVRTNGRRYRVSSDVYRYLEAMQ